MKDILFYSIKIEEVYEYINFIKILSESGFNLYLTTEKYCNNSSIDCYFKSTHYDLIKNENIKYCFILNINDKNKFDKILDSFVTVIIYNQKYYLKKTGSNKSYFLENSNYVLNFYEKLKLDNLRNYKMFYFSNLIELFKKNLIKDRISIYVHNNYDSKILKKILLFIDKYYHDRFRFVINDIDNPYLKEDIDLRNFKLELSNHEILKFVSKSNSPVSYLSDCNYTLIVSENININYFYDSFVLGKPLIVLENSNINSFTHDPNSYITLKCTNNKELKSSIEEIINYNIDYSKIIYNYYKKFDKTKFTEVFRKFIIEIEKKN